jgi:hypothetical protein
MPGRSVVVATYIHSYEAELARNLLESQGVPAFLTGGSMAGLASLLDAFRLEVHADDAQRASAILAEVALEDDWEQKAESGAGVWTCSICGEPVSESMGVCFACSTPRDAIRADAPVALHAIRDEPAPADGIQSEDEPLRSPGVSNEILGAAEPGSVEEDSIGGATSPADGLAQQAFFAAMLGWMVVLLLPLAWWRLLQAYERFDELSAGGRRRFFGAVAINFMVILCYALIAFLVLGSLHFGM